MPNLQYSSNIQRIATLATGLALALVTNAFGVEPPVDLAGQWAFRLDPTDVGVAERWHARHLPDKIHLPGSLQEQGFGNDVSIDTSWTGQVVDRSWFTDPRYEPYRRTGHVKVPFWLQPDKHYVGVAWYQRSVTPPSDWFGRRIMLYLERPHWETRVWVDDHEIGTCNSLGAAHQFDLTQFLVPGARKTNRHRITIRIDNRIRIAVGLNAHSVTDHTQSNWNGITGRLELRCTDRVWIGDLQVFPHPETASITVRGRIDNRTGGAGSGKLTISATCIGKPDRYQPEAIEVPVAWSVGGKRFEAEFPLGEQRALWNEFTPVLYSLTVRLDGRDRECRFHDSRTTTFGLRELGIDGTQFTINGRKVFFRGTLECCIFPLTGYPPTDVGSWKRIIRVCKQYGLNHIRFHSWCPPEAAFTAADQLGFYYQVECGAWTRIGNGEPIDSWLYDEGRRIRAAYGNHPSFVLMAYGNEPGGPERGAKFLRKWCTYWKKEDPRCLHTSAGGWPLITESDYHNTPKPRIQQWGAGLRSLINAKQPETRFDYRDFVHAHATKPTISHEIGQWCVYPNFKEIPKYRGLLKARNFEIFRDFLNDNHMGDQADQFVMASGKLQTLCYKAEIEAALRTPGFGGFQLLDLHDFPGQGTALVGVVDPFWDPKPYVSSQEYRRFCGVTVPLARMDKRTWTRSETLIADVEIAHYGPAPLQGSTVYWKLVDANGRTRAEGDFTRRDIPVGSNHAAGRVALTLDRLDAPASYRLVVGIQETTIENDWSLWVYPNTVGTDPPNDVLIVSKLDSAAEKKLQQGGKVLLLANTQAVNSDVAIGFSSVFWNTAWTRGQAPHTLGILCNPNHPVFAEFPTEYHTNWQWWELVHGSAAMILDNLPPQLRPAVQPIDTWFKSRRLGLLFEANVSGGRLMVCSMDLATDLPHRIVARQLRHSLLDYMHSEAFEPATRVKPRAIRALFRSAATPAAH